MRSGRKTEGCLYNYTLLPLHMFHPFTEEELKQTETTLTGEFSFTKGIPVMKIPASGATSPNNTCYQYEDHIKYGDLLFDLEADPYQQQPIQDGGIEEQMLEAMRALMKAGEAPAELYERMGIEK